VFFTESSAQSVNDYRSVASGNWTSLSVWQTYNGSSWVAATTYPGQVAGTNDISIEGGFSVTLSANVPNAFNSLTIGDGTGATDVLLISAASNLITSQVTIANGGFVSWTANVTLSLPAGAAFVIESGGSVDNSTPCSAAKRLVIGAIVFSACNGGGGASYSFTELNTGGGSLNVSPSSNSPICVGDILTLFSNAEGLGSTSATFSWSATGPGGYTFSSTLEDPTVSGLTAGTYTYTVTATGGSLSNTNSTEVIVNSAPNVPTSMGNETICDGDAIPTLSASVNSGETVDWYDAASGGTLLLSGNTSYTPSTAGSYYAEARNTTTGCVSSTRTVISITSNPCPSGPGKIIMNRHINFRINN
jgi:Ig-like domain-containing protein